MLLAPRAYPLLRTHGQKDIRFLISILLMMVCVQTFSMHFHFSEGNQVDHHSHAHAHSTGDLDADHLVNEHDQEATNSIQGAITKQALSIEFFVFILLAIVTITQAKLRIRTGIRRKRPRYYLLFYRPPLRAPPF